MNLFVTFDRFFRRPPERVLAIKGQNSRIVINLAMFSETSTEPLAPLVRPGRGSKRHCVAPVNKATCPGLCISAWVSRCGIIMRKLCVFDVRLLICFVLEFWFVARLLALIVCLLSRRRASPISIVFVACAFLDVFFYIALMSYMLYIFFTGTSVGYCPMHNPLDFNHSNVAYVQEKSNESMIFYGFSAILLSIFFLFFLIDALAGENAMQLMVMMVMSVMVTYYTVYKSVRFQGLNYA